MRNSIFGDWITYSTYYPLFYLRPNNIPAIFNIILCYNKIIEILYCKPSKESINVMYNMVLNICRLTLICLFETV